MATRRILSLLSRLYLRWFNRCGLADESSGHSNRDVLLSGAAARETARRRSRQPGGVSQRRRHLFNEIPADASSSPRPSEATTTASTTAAPIAFQPDIRVLVYVHGNAQSMATIEKETWQTARAAPRQWTPNGGHVEIDVVTQTDFRCEKKFRMKSILESFSLLIDIVFRSARGRFLVELEYRRGSDEVFFSLSHFVFQW